MTHLLGLVLLSFFITSFFMVPFINFLFYLKARYKRPIPKGYDDSKTPIHNKLLKGKDVNTPVGGGILIIVLLIILSLGYTHYFKIQEPTDIYILILTLVSFGFIGLIDDVQKILIAFSGKYAGIKALLILVLQTIFALLLGTILYLQVGLNNIYIAGLGNFVIGLWYIPLAAFMIVAFSNAYNVSDGLDGLSSGLLLICLFALLVLAQSGLNLNLAVFVGIWIGALLAFLYFNVNYKRV